MKQLITYLLVLQEIEQDKKDLKTLGLTEEEIEGYIEFYAENFFPAQKGGSNKCLN
jgi:hypothetical protein